MVTFWTYAGESGTTLIQCIITENKSDQLLYGNGNKIDLQRVKEKPQSRHYGPSERHIYDPFSRRIAISTFEVTIFQLQPLLK